MFGAFRCPGCLASTRDWRHKSQLLNGHVVHCDHCGAALQRGKLAGHLGFVLLSLLSQFGGVLALFWWPKPMPLWMFVPAYLVGCILPLLAWWWLATLLPLRVGRHRP